MGGRLGATATLIAVGNLKRACRPTLNAQPGLPRSGVGLLASTWRKDSDTV
jgi:hypothetical protein